jgi:polysaccharide biosynthesis transport protein
MEIKEYTEEIDFQKYWLVLKRRWPIVLGTFGTMLGLATFLAMRQQPSYEAMGKLLVKTERTSSLTGLDVNIGEIETLGSTLQKDPLDTQAEIVKSRPIVEQALRSTEPPQTGEATTTSALLKDLKIKAIPGTDVLEISYQSADAEYAERIVNEVMEAYIKNNISTNREEAVAARQFIADQLPQTEASVGAAETDLRRFKEQNRIVALEQEAAQAVTNIGNLNTQIDQARAELADVNARSATLRRQLGVRPDLAVDLSALSQSSGVQEVLAKLQTAQSQLAIERTRYRETHPTVTNLQRQVDSLSALLQQRVAEITSRNQTISVGGLQFGELKQNLLAEYLRAETSRIGLSQRIVELSALQSTYKTRATALPALEKTQRELERRLTAAQTTYEALLAKLQEVQVAENQNVGNARVIEAAKIPEEPVASRKRLILAAGGVAGLLLGIAAAFLIDLLDQSVKTLRESRELFGYTLLGVIPAFGRTGKLSQLGLERERTAPRIISRDMPNLMVQEAYQMLQANLKFLSSDRELKTLVVTSSMTGEGKSEVAANLAAAIAQVGRRVLLIDADMRHPTQHVAWNLSSSIGLSHVLVGQNEVHEAIQEVIPNLYLLPSGVTPPNPIALLDSNRMATLLSDFSGRYDFVIFDTPPVTACADASVLGRMTDGIVLVVRPGILNNAAGSAAKEMLTSAGQNVLGIIVNGVDVRNEPDSYFHYTQNYAKNRSNVTSATLVGSRHSDS